MLGQVLPGLSARLLPADVSRAHLPDAFCRFGVLLPVANTGARFR
ncbi:hypothetical protein [Streptomyces sp. SM11]|nr:hypothetical protein [Streptomyces sp. SM11]